MIKLRIWSVKKNYNITNSLDKMNIFDMECTAVGILCCYKCTKYCILNKL